MTPRTLAITGVLALGAIRPAAAQAVAGTVNPRVVPGDQSATGEAAAA